MMLNVAVIGIGNMGKNHARIYSELSDVNLVAVCDVNKKLGTELSQKYGCKYYEDYDELIHKEKLDAVSVVVPTTLHKRVALAFLNKKINVLLEKPISNDVENAKEIIDAAKKNNVKLLIGHIERYNPVILKLKDMIKKGIFGDIIAIDSKRVGGYPSQIKDSDVVTDVAIHDIDILNFLYESTPAKIYSNKGTALGKTKADYVDILFSYGGGKSGSIQCNWVTPVKIRILTVTGTKAYAELNYMTQELKLFESDVIKTFDDFGDFVVKFGNPTITDIPIEKEEPLKNELMNFINAVNGKEKLKMNPEDAVTALKTVLEILHTK